MCSHEGLLGLVSSEVQLTTIFLLNITKFQGDSQAGSRNHQSG